jgi:hypothetical protein
MRSSNKKNRTVLIPSRSEQYYTDRSENFCLAEQLPPLSIRVQPGLAAGFSLCVPNFDSRCIMSGWSRRISGPALAGAIYDCTEHTAKSRAIASFECAVCNQTMETWNTASCQSIGFVGGQ